MRALGTGDGRPLPTHLVAELNRLRRRLSLTLEMIRELDAVREQALEAQHDSASRTVKALCTIGGIGVNFASVLTREVFYRTFDNRRQIASESSAKNAILLRRARLARIAERRGL
jgi:transposase